MTTPLVEACSASCSTKPTCAPRPWTRPGSSPARVIVDARAPAGRASATVAAMSSARDAAWTDMSATLRRERPPTYRSLCRPLLDSFDFLRYFRRVLATDDRTPLPACLR